MIPKHVTIEYADGWLEMHHDVRALQTQQDADGQSNVDLLLVDLHVPVRPVHAERAGIVRVTVR